MNLNSFVVTGLERSTRTGAAMAEAFGPVGRPAELLLVEDNQGDIMLTQEALKTGKIANRLHIARDGEQALRMLLKQPPYAAQTTPDLILLDLNLPRKDGRELLAEIKSTPAIAKIPVVVLIGSRAEVDFIRSRELNAVGYVVKPLDFEQLREVVASIDHFWFTVMQLTPDDRRALLHDA